MYFVKNCVGLMGAGSARKSFKVGNDQKCLKTTVQQWFSNYGMCFTVGTSTHTEEPNSD